MPWKSSIEGRHEFQSRMRTVKVIFLDIDGVLNCRSTPNPRKFPYVVDPRLLARLNTVTVHTGAAVVLSSTWRYDPAGLFSAEYHRVPFIDVIPDMPHRPRREEILAWLAEHRDVTKYAVLDDEDDELDDLPLFQPSSRTGLTEKMADALCAFLQGGRSEDMRRNVIIRRLLNLRSLIRGHRG
jgi:hypothetical protein